MKSRNNFIIDAIKRSLAILPPVYKKRSLLLLFGIIINSFFDLIGLASILPLLAAVLKKEILHENYYFSWTYEALNFSSDNQFIIFLCCVLFFFIIGKNLLGILIHKKQIEFTWDIYDNISKDVLRSIYDRGFLFLKGKNSNDLQNDIVVIPHRFCSFLILPLFSLLNELVMLLFVISLLMVYDIKIVALLFSIIIPVFLLFYSLTKKKISNINEQMNTYNPLILKPIYELVFGFVDVVIMKRYKYFEQSYLSKIRSVKKLREQLKIFEQIPTRLIEVCIILAVILILIYGLFVLESSEKVVGLLSVFALAAYRSVPSINRLMLSTINVKSQLFTLSLIEDFLPHKERKNNRELNFEKEIKLENLGFSYPNSETPVFDNINLNIRKGESVGLIGKSGSGKTTLMNILLGFLNTEECTGKILIDGKELNKDSIESWQDKIGYVSQDVFLIEGNLIENIAFGLPANEVNLEKINRIIDQAQLRDFVNDLPNGLYSDIGERGANISGGQRQRLGIARALYNNVDILFLDEATSALDNETENHITESLKNLNMRELTIIMIAHRENTLKYCDHIYEIGS